MLFGVRCRPHSEGCAGDVLDYTNIKANIVVSGQSRANFRSLIFLKLILYTSCILQKHCSLCMSLWVKMPRKNKGPFGVFFSQSLWLKCPLMCLPGSLELDCSWIAPQCESPQVISLAKSKYLNIFRIFFGKTLNGHYSSTVRAFDLIPKLRAKPEYQLSSGTNYTAWIALAFFPARNLL